MNQGLFHRGVFLLLLLGVVLGGGPSSRAGQLTCVRGPGNMGERDVCCTDHHGEDTGLARGECVDCFRCTVVPLRSTSERNSSFKSGKSAAQESLIVPQFWQSDTIAAHPISIGGERVDGTAAHAPVSTVVLRC